ncbi:hypothetical protein YC2023_059836 [Brassica napus]
MSSHHFDKSTYWIYGRKSFQTEADFTKKILQFSEINAGGGPTTITLFEITVSVHPMPIGIFWFRSHQQGRK